MGIAESGDIQDESWLCLDGLREIGILRGRRTKRHLIQTYDILVMARCGPVQLVMAPPNVYEAVAGVALLVTRVRGAHAGMGHNSGIT